MSLEVLRQDAERLSSQSSLSDSRDEALSVAIQAAETSMRALDLISDPVEQARYKSRVKQLIKDAEAIKNNPDWSSRTVDHSKTDSRSPTSPIAKHVKTLKAPCNSRELTRKEQIILLQAGFLNGAKFPEWQDPPSLREFELQDGEELYIDEHSELPLADYQFDVLDDWKRPSDALPPPGWFSRDRTHLGPSMTPHTDIDLVQDAATDCSVVASMCAGVARSQRGHQRLLQSFMYPYDHENNRLLISKNGKYMARLNFNGCFRKVVIDDRIPTTSSEQVIHVVDRNNPGLLWPALVEKAYLKVRGGYDFPGSNSATDLWILTGWIPEQVFLQSDDLDLDRLWKRITGSFTYGDVLITMGTGKMSDQTERAIGLAGEHDYAVLDLQEVEGQRLMLVKNPWMEGTSWKGRFKRAAQSHERDKTSNDVLFRVEGDMEPVSSPRDLLNDNDQLTPGTFWMDLDSVAQHFESIYLNWNPGLFSCRQDIHFEWDLSESSDDKFRKPRGSRASLRHHRQFIVTAVKKDTIWVLLWHHLQNFVPEDATDEDIESGRHFVDPNGYICLRAFASHGRRIVLPDKYLEPGFFLDSPQVLLKLENCEPGKPYTIVPLEQELSATKHTFTLSAFSRSSIAISDAIDPYAFQVELNATWNRETAGGNASHPTYCDNPQFSVAVPSKTNIRLLLETCEEELVVHLKLVHSKGKRLFQVRSMDVIVHSNDYRRGCCFAELQDLDPGQYTVICSTFEPQQLGDFTLCISSTQPVKASLLPREGADRFRIELGAAAFRQDETKLAAPLVLRRLINFYAIVRHVDQQQADNHAALRANRSQVRLSIELGRGPTRRILAISNTGEYADCARAVRTDPLDLSADYRKYGHGDCWIVLERMYSSTESREERFSVQLLVDTPNGAEAGSWRPWED